LTTPSIAPAPPSDFRQHVKNISHQSSVFLIGTMFSTAAAYFFKIYLARVLGAEALGIYALGMTVVGLVGVIAAAGLPQAASRFVAVYSAKSDFRKLGRFLWSALAVLLVSNLLVASLLLLAKSWIAQRVYHTPALSGYMPFFVLIMITGAWTGFLGQALAGFKDVARRTVITNFIGQTLTMACTIALLTAGFGFKGYLAAQIASAVVVLLLLGRETWRLSPPPARMPSFGLPILEREIVAFSTVLFGVQVLEFLASQTDKIMLGIYLNAREVGIYSIATALVAFVSIFLQSINQIFAPTIAELHASRQNDLLLNLYQTLTKWVLGFTMPLAFVIMIFARPLMEIFGREFGEGWPVLVIATVGQLVNCGVGSVGQLLLMSGQQQRMIRAQAIAVPVGLVILWVMIPRLGLIGAATAGAVTNALLNLLWLRDVKRTLSLLPSRSGYFSLFLPALATLSAIGLVRYGLRDAHHQFLMVIAGLVAGYAIFLLVAIAVSLNDSDKMLARSAWAMIRRSLPANAE
jgi:O-antigen/teichoic acid export membrane protein